MAVTLASTPPTPLPVDAQWVSFEIGYTVPLVNAQTINSATTTTTAAFTVPYIAVGAKAKLVLNIATLTGTATPGLAVNYFESLDGVNFNPSAALSIASQTATGTYWSSAATAPVFNGGQLSFTVVGTTPSVTFSVWLAVWNK